MDECVPAEAFLSASMSSGKLEGYLCPPRVQADVMRTQIKLEQQWVESLQRR